MKYLLVGMLLSSLSLRAQNFAEHWATSHAATGDNSDRYNDLLRDGAGNLYAGGYTLMDGQGKDFLLVKMGSNGDTVWTRSWNGTGDGADEIVAMAFDNSGNILAAGFTKSADNGRDFAVAKYSNAGALLWVSSFNHTANLDDEAVDVASDASGNVLLTGVSYNSAGNADYLTVKYNSAGALQWSMRYDGADNLDDAPAALTVDASGNVIVTGKTATAGSADDYGTVSYSSGGTEQWVMTYDQTGNTDRATGIVSDASGNVYVTGRSQIGNDDSYITIKYNSSGSQQWLKTYDSGLGDDRADVIAISSNSSYIAVSGRVDDGTQTDIRTLVYDAAGTQQWSSLYFHVNGRSDRPTDVFVSNTGEVAMCGTVDVSTALTEQLDQLLVSYSATGTQNWAKVLSGSAGLNDGTGACWIDGSGNVYMAGYRSNNNTHRDATTTCYNSAGVEQFNVSYNGLGEFTEKGIELVESAGSVYALGYVYNFPNDMDVCLIKYDAAGNKVWVKTWDSDAHDTDDPAAVAADASGNIYVAGRTKNLLGDYDAFILKYNSAGTLVWSQIYDIGLGLDEELTDIAVDGSGNVLVCGNHDVNPHPILEDVDWMMLQYDAAGNFVWSQTKSGSGFGNDYAEALTASISGHATVVGRLWNGADYDIATTQFASSNGNENWSIIYNGTFGDDVPAGIVRDASDNYFVGGKSDRAAGITEDEDFVMLKYNAAGVNQWAKYFSGTTGGKDEMNDLAVDADGNSYYIGESDGDATAARNEDYITVKLDAAGNEVWSKRFESSAQQEDIAYGVAVGDSGKVFVTGQSNEGSALVKNNNIVTVIYDADGAELQHLSWNGAASLSDGGEDVMAGSDGAIYVTGFGQAAVASQRDMLTVRYVIGVGVNEISADVLNVYPIPVSADAHLHLQLGSQTESEYSILNMMGEEVASNRTVDGIIQLKSLSLQGGIYFLRLKESTTAVVKFIIQ